MLSTVANSPSRFAKDIKCTSSALRKVPEKSRCSKAKVASETTTVAKPRLPAVRALDSTDLAWKKDGIRRPAHVEQLHVISASVLLRGSNLYPSQLMNLIHKAMRSGGRVFCGS